MHTRGYHVFSVENFLSHSAEKIRGHPFNVSENLGYRKILCIIGGITSFRRKFFVSQCRKISWGNPSVMFQKISSSERVYGKEGGGVGVSRVSVESFLSHSVENFRRGTL